MEYENTNVWVDIEGNIPVLILVLMEYENTVF